MLKLDYKTVKNNLVKNEYDEASYEVEFAGVQVAVDVYLPDGSTCVYCVDNVLYTFSKDYNNLKHAINSVNLWLKDASYKQ